MFKLVTCCKNDNLYLNIYYMITNFATSYAEGDDNIKLKIVSMIS